MSCGPNKDKEIIDPQTPNNDSHKSSRMSELFMGIIFKKGKIKLFVY